MYYTKNRRNKPLYKKILPLRKNVQNSNKIIQFRKLKWQKFRHLVLKLNKQKFYDPISYFLSNFGNFFSKKFKYNLQNKQRLRFFYGNLRKGYLKKVVKLTLKKSKKLNTHSTTLFIEKLETRLDTTLYRTYFCSNFNHARQLISHQKISVNNKVVQHKFFELKKGDLITVDSSIRHVVISSIMQSKTWTALPKHLYVNYKTLQILIIEDVKYTNCLAYHHF